MFEIAKTLLNAKKLRTKNLVAIMSALILLLVYGAGFMTLPMTILYSYQSKNCGSVLSLDKIYTSIYPGFIQDESLSSRVKECEAYRLAASNEEKRNWQDAYDSYQAYSATYPNGLYAAEAHEHGAITLLNIVKDQAEGQRYEEAVANLNLIVSDYSDTSVSAEAWTLFPSMYTAWGTGLRESVDFEKAEQVFNQFKTWSQNNQKADAEKTAQSELAKTYLAWGLALQSQKQFEGALAKFDLAASADPESAAQAQTGKVKIYLEWGNDLLGQKEFAAAMEKFEQAVSVADTNNKADATDALANGHIQWASALKEAEDFEGALAQLESAKQTAVSEAMKKFVDRAFGEAYLAFSNSSGTQARRAMKEALIAVCKQHKEPKLPIFGLNKDSIRVGVYGVDAQLPESLAARTPGELHYVACVEEGSKTIESRYHRVILLRTSRGYYYTIVQQFRAQLLWNINLLKTDTMESVAKKTFAGDMPPPFSEEDTGNYFSGPPPAIAELEEWLLSIIK